jgi:hypothetical protein|tara:strand:- start:64 stop:261 length:198 start_codon:yes stop_codon:yes gene_type:complete
VVVEVVEMVSDSNLVLLLIQHQPIERPVNLEDLVVEVVVHLVLLLEDQQCVDKDMQEGQQEVALE